MADVGTTPTAETTGTETNTNTSNNENTGATPTVDELLAQLANEKAEKEKYKNASDKASSEAAKYKKELRSKQTLEEQEAEAKAEADRAKDEELEELRKELNHNKAVSAYKAIENEKTVETLIEAVSENDHNAIATILENEKKLAVKEAQAEWLKSRPQANAGAYSSMTKEQILAIENREERLKAIAQNQDLFKWR